MDSLKQKNLCRKLLACFATGLISLVLVVLWASPVDAQSFYGTVLGTVTDSTGGVVPNAAVTLTNIGTNDKRTAQTDAAGSYRFVNLVPANYRLEVEMTGFKRLAREPITVQVGSEVRVDAALELGTQTETIEISAASPLLQTESGTVSQVVEGKVVQEMPLNGRNVMNLLALVPGVVPQQSTSGAPANNAVIHTYVNGWGNYSIGGGIANESANYIDGAGNNMLGGNSPALVMTQDMVQEFKVESGAVSAEYGHFGGGVVNMVTKSGANSWHGSLYEYLRNTLLNSNDFASEQANLPKSPWHQNQYGATLGGPIKKDKAFFMFSWENYSLHKAQGSTFYVPTKAMRGEDPAFAGAVVNNPIHSNYCAGIKNYGDEGAPAGLQSGQGFIPASCIDPVAKKMMGFYAYPNMALTNGKNFAGQPLTGDDAYQYNIRVDYNLSDKQRIFGRYTNWHLQDIGEDDFGGKPGNFQPSDYGSTGNQTHNIVVGDTIMLKNNITVDIHAAYMRDYFWNYGSAQGTFDSTQFGTSGWNSLAKQMTYKETPIFGLIGNDGFSGPWNIPVGANQVDLYQAFSLNYNMTWIAGKHTLKFGGESMLRYHSGIGNYAWDGGQAMFMNFVTGDEWASFMLGEYLSNTMHSTANSYSTNRSNGLYFTDSWRAASKLTLNLGLRWDLPGGIYEKHDNATVFLPTVVDPNNKLPGALALTNSPLYSSRNVSPDRHDLFGPRASFAYSATNSLVLRGGYGLSYIPPDMPIGLMAFNSPINGADTACKFGQWKDPLACTGNKLIQPLGRSDLNPGHVFYNQVIQSPVPTDKYPYMQQWNFVVSKQWKGDILTEVQYVGSRGTNLPSSGLGTGTGGSFTSINELPSRYFSMGYAALAATAPCANLGGSSVQMAKCLQPFPQYTNVLDTGANNGGQRYNALHVVFAKRFATGGVINANYTYSHTEGNTDQPGFGGGGSVQDFNNMAAEWSVASFDVKHRMIMSYVLDLPFGKGKKWLNKGGAINGILGGWQVNGITTMQSGFPYSFQYSSPNTDLFQSGNQVNNSWGAGIARPDILPGCDLNTSGSWIDKYKNNNFFNAACLVAPGFTSQKEYQDYVKAYAAYNGGKGDSTAVAYYNTVWAPIMDKRNMLFGNAPRNTDAVRSQHLINFDFAVSKKISIKEKADLLCKVEFFNLFNTVLFGNAGGQLAASGFDQPGQFVTANTPRLVQISLRLNF